ncbi:Acetyl- synthetase [Pyrenophora seminiperda CCB06]|uniref:Acetyl-synthetase n=1 Tax=Pyrenophora seminiperda CCB06 TaxID=1302712 RepID=A0A3M7M496_9PLEO|nr:Acetyl- synthetase [Pyrenophora seminiperda CCB06]
MRYTLLALATAASFASAQTSEIPVGKNCTPGGTKCAEGADCYAVNSMAQTVCGNFQSSCTSDKQCAFNTCNQGACNGFIASSSAAASSASATITSTPTAPGAMPAPSSTIVAPAGSLALGAECNPHVTPSQCAKDAECWASNMMLIARCGNFNAGCKVDSQCAFNSCNNGLCNGFLASSAPAAGNATMMTSATMPAASASSGPIGNGTVIASKSATPTTTGAVQFTGAASVDNAARGILALVAGAAVLAL